ncbi:MAG: 16S rRNA (cytosine(1402)-N(4))-methyltransferase RsmH [Clostridia bacterium]|nr:16S rRNA (cytosine(1402)-N(4))-methyltransferase RsmH [Clostridia bacterium]
MSEYHRPIMEDEVVEGLCLKKGGVYFDGTVGGGGHSYAILSGNPEVTVVATDKDTEAIEEATKRLSPFQGKYEIYHSDFKDYERVFEEAGIEKIDGFLLDLGISSHQIDDEKRGFAYRLKKAPLDMRMDQSKDFSAKDVVNGYSEEALKKLLREYGEERFAGAIAKKIVNYREKKPVETCGELENLIREGIPAKFRSAACARQSFQAIRIEVNGELSGLGDCVRGLVGRLKTGGRGCVLTFHSLEDRIVKQIFKDMATGCTCPKEFPVCVCGRKEKIKLIGRYRASEEEMKENSRSKCAKLRVIEKISE